MPSASLRTKIYLGFSFLVGLLVLNGLVSYFGLQQLRDAIARKQRIQDTTTAILTLDRDVQELSLRVDRYVTSGQESLRNGVGLLQERMKTHLGVAEDQSIDPTVQELFAQIGTALDAYRTQFDQVVIERRVREDLVQTEMPMLAAQVRSELESLSSVVSQDSGLSPSALALTECQSLFTESERSFLKYFATPSTKEVNSAATSLAAARRRLSEVASEEETAVARTLIRDYERIGLRAVQATRGYLFFRNVVMAGEASEIAYYAESLRKLAVSKSSEIAAEVTATRERVNRTAIGAVLAAVVLGAYIAWRLASLVVPPVLALTRAFNRLSDGETLEEIPAVDRRDEIGQMARAARVFSDRNQQTRELLEHSEELSSDLKRQAAVLEETNQELDNFAYVASHDLKSPLRGIRQLALWIEEDAADSLPDDSKTHLSQMQTRVVKMEQLLDDLLAYSRIGRQTPRAEPVDLAAVIADIVEITDNPNQVSVTYPENLPTMVTDRVPLEQVLRNLIGNAIKYNDRKQQGRVTIDLEMESDRCRIGIADNGPGIARKDQERAFQMYQRVNSTSTDGTGMGLAIVKKQVEHQGGSIQLSSELGEGARFEFTWPVLSE